MKISVSSFMVSLISCLSAVDEEVCVFECNSQIEPKIDHVYVKTLPESFSFSILPNRESEKTDDFLEHHGYIIASFEKLNEEGYCESHGSSCYHYFIHPCHYHRRHVTICDKPNITNTFR